MDLGMLARSVLFVSMIACPACSGSGLAGVASVIDGDTIELHGRRIRLEGIDAPESAQTCRKPSGEIWRCGQVAAFALSDKIGRAAIRCDPSGTDRYGRTLATCFLGAENLNRWLVVSGHAVAYRRYSVEYVGAEDGAHRDRRGIWAGTFTMPEEWRRSRGR